MNEKKLWQEPAVSEKSAKQPDAKSERLQLRIEKLEQRLAPTLDPPPPIWGD